MDRSLPTAWRRRRRKHRFLLLLNAIFVAIWGISIVSLSSFLIGGTRVDIGNGIVEYSNRSLRDVPTNVSIIEPHKVPDTPPTFYFRFNHNGIAMLTSLQDVYALGFVMPSFERISQPVLCVPDLELVEVARLIWTDVTMPFWIPTGLAALMLLIAKLKFRLPEVYQCFGCQYDLRGNTSGTCPECGRPIPDDQIAYVKT